MQEKEKLHCTGQTVKYSCSKCTWHLGNSTSSCPYEPPTSTVTVALIEPVCDRNGCVVYSDSGFLLHIKVQV